MMITPLLEAELNKLKKTKDTIEEISIMIELYKEDLNRDISSIEAILQVRQDKKFNQIESALEFVMQDLMKYAKARQPKEEIKVENKEKDIDIQEKSIKQGKATVQRRSGRKGSVSTIEIIECIQELLKSENRSFSVKEILDYVWEKLPRIKDTWKGHNRRNVFSMVLTHGGHGMKRVKRGEYTLQ